jgi:hypothetical protein
MVIRLIVGISTALSILAFAVKGSALSASTLPEDEKVTYTNNLYHRAARLMQSTPQEFRNENGYIQHLVNHCIPKDIARKLLTDISELNDNSDPNGYNGTFDILNGYRRRYYSKEEYNRAKNLISYAHGQSKTPESYAKYLIENNFHPYTARTIVTDILNADPKPGKLQNSAGNSANLSFGINFGFSARVNQDLTTIGLVTTSGGTLTLPTAGHVYIPEEILRNLPGDIIITD